MLTPSGHKFSKQTQSKPKVTPPPPGGFVCLSLVGSSCIANEVNQIFSETREKEREKRERDRERDGGISGQRSAKL